MNISKLIRDIPDFPKPGIVFKDITPILGNPDAFRECIDELAMAFSDCGATKILAAEARGFIFGATLAYKMGMGFVPVRKPGKLPYKTISASYELEYGTDTLCMHEDAVAKGEKILLIDDLLATGGTVGGMQQLVDAVGAQVVGIGFLMELDFLHGRQKLGSDNVVSLIHCHGE